MGTKLFLRTPAGHVLTAAGRDILRRVEDVEREVEGIERIALGRDLGERGVVRVTTTKWFAAAVLPSIVGPVGVRHPGLVVDVVAAAGWMSLSKREADIALRFTRFDHDDIVQRKVARVTFGLYASDAYLDVRGPPDFARGCVGHCVVAFNEQVTTASDGAYLDAIAPRATVSFRSNSRDALARAAAAGAGMACLPDHLGVRTPGLRRITPPKEAPTRFVWLGVHVDTKDIPRIRSVTRALVDGLSAIAGDLAPDLDSRPSRCRSSERTRTRTT